MRRISETELADLGAAFGVTVTDAEAPRLTEQVNDLLEDLARIDDVPAGSDAAAGGDRDWRRPETDPHGAISVRCHVPPTADHDGRLADVTVGLKDIVALGGVPMACGSEVMAGFVPGSDATVVERLRAAGATITHKTSLDEFAGAPHGVTGRGGAITNPFDGDRVAGGSSGGSAVAVATGEVDVALGTDTGGSIRIPAAFCGTVGLKPTYGLVPLRGVVENTYTLDHVGPLSRSVADAARTLEALAGTDERDPASLQAAGREGYRVGGYVDAVEDSPAPEDLVVAALEDGFGDGVSDGVAEATSALLDRLADAGATVRTVSVPHFEYGAAIKNCLSFAEMVTHWRAGGAPYRRGGVVDEGYQTGLARRGTAASRELGEFYKRKLLAGAALIEGTNGRWYTRAQATREVLREEVDAALDGVDALAFPTLPDVAPRIEDAFDVEIDYARNTRAANVTRHPAITLPNGAVDGLPVGVQLLAPAFDEAGLLGAAATVAGHTDPLPTRRND
jgi:amidase/aspartyl-tRNA(Asn)/glutamyl-tRNA(Gln) amidotransferase subunit A